VKAVVHIGTEKTGTTTIKEFLHQNRDELVNQGVAYLRSLGLRENRKLATYCMNNNIDDHVKDLGIISESKRDEWKERLRQDFDQEVQNLDRNISTVIIASEHFHSRLKTVDEITNLPDILKPHFNEIKIWLFSKICG